MSISEFEYDKSDSDVGGGERPRSGTFPLRIPRRSRYNGQRTTLSPKDKTIHGWSIKFSKFPSDRSFGYVVMYPQAKAECIEEPLKVLTTRFNFQEPGLIISVIGELSEDLSLQWTLNTFKDSLSLTLRTTGGWTLTSGLDNPLNRLVSEAHRCRRSEPVPAMGVARWDEKLLRRSENTLPARRDNEKTYLENNHSMFVFFEKGMSRLNVQNDLIVRLEKFLIQRARMDFRALAVVKLLVGGGLVHLQKIHQAVTNNIPVLILQGTGGAADVLATAMDESDDDIPDSDEDVPSEDGSETDEAKASRIKLQATKIAVYCRNNPDLLRKFDLSDVTTAAALQIAFLKSALKAPRLSCKDRISAFLCWDHDLSSLQTLSQALLQDVDMEALVTQKPKLLGQMLKNALFTRHFLTQVVSFLKTSHIQALYQDSKDILFPDIQTAPWKVTFVNIRELLKSLYPPLESIGFYFQKSDHNLTSSEEKIVHLFLWSVLSNRESVSRVLWEEVPEPLLAALVAYKILTQQSKKFKRPMLALDRHASMFETLAVELLDQYHQTSVEHTRAVLSKKSLTWGKVSSFRMAIESQAVISHESFEPVINEVWMGDLANSNSRWKVFWYALFQMRFCLDFKRAKGIKEICKSSTSAPVIKYFSFMLSYLAFLAAYTINLLLGPSEQVPALSWLVALWVFAALVEEISQVTRFRGLSLMTTLIFGPHLLFTVGFILRNPHRVLDYQWGTLLLSIALAFFYLSALRFFLAFRALGIKVVMMREMMFNMVIFMMIMITIMFGYGIAIEVTLFPEASISEHGARNLLRRPVWQLFGELLLDEIESMPECPDNSTGDGDDGCPSDLGKRIAPAMTAIYMFITNVLLLNLLIAIFSSTYRKVESSAVRYLNYESYRLAMEFAVRSYFPPPLSLLENVYTLVRRCMRCQGSTFEDLAQEIHSQAVEEGMEVHKSKEDVRWEEAMQDRYLERVQERELQLSPGSADDILASTLPRPPQAFNSARRESNFSLDGPSPSEELVSFRRVFTKQMSELNDRLYRIESQLHANSREIKTTLTRQAGFDRESVKKKDEEDSRC